MTHKSPITRCLRSIEEMKGFHVKFTGLPILYTFDGHWIKRLNLQLEAKKKENRSTNAGFALLNEWC